VVEVKAERVDVSILAAATAVVGGASLAFDVQGSVLGMWVFLDLATPFLLYSGVAMTTTPERNVATRERVVPAGPVAQLDAWFDAESRVSFPFLPPIYPKNLRFVLPTFLLLLVPVLGIGGGLAVEGWGIGRRAGGSVTALVDQFGVFQRPLVAVIGIIVVLAQAGRFYRCHVTTGRYKQWTTHMLLEVQVQYVLWYAFLTILFVLYAILTFVLVGQGVGPFVSDALGRTIWLATVLPMGLLVKVAFERSRVRGERQLDVGDDSFTANFSPTPPD